MAEPQDIADIPTEKQYSNGKARQPDQCTRGRIPVGVECKDDYRQCNRQRKKVEVPARAAQQ